MNANPQNRRATTTLHWRLFHFNTYVKVHVHSYYKRAGGGGNVIGCISERSVVQNGWPRVVQFEE